MGLCWILFFSALKLALFEFYVWLCRLAQKNLLRSECTRNRHNEIFFEQLEHEVVEVGRFFLILSIACEICAGIVDGLVLLSEGVGQMSRLM